MSACPAPLASRFHGLFHRLAACRRRSRRDLDSGAHVARAAFHSEDEFRLEERKPLRVKGDPNSHHVWRDVTTALQCTERLVRIAREKGAAIHVLHISTEEEIEFSPITRMSRPLKRRLITSRSTRAFTRRSARSCR